MSDEKVEVKDSVEDAKAETPEFEEVDVQSRAQQDATGETPKTEVETLTEQIETLKASEAEAQLKALRAAAEMENFKKRKNQEVETTKKYAAERVITEFMPFLDSFELAISHAETLPEATQNEIVGFINIHKQLVQAIEKLGVTKIDALNQAFDPNMHQAIAQEKQEGTDSGIVIKEMQKGFKLHDRVIRPSMVVVSE